MSYNERNGHGGGGRRRYRDDHDLPERRKEVYEAPEQKVRSAVVKIGEDQHFNPRTDLPQVAQYLRQQATTNFHAIVDGFRIGVTEQPFKTPFYAALLGHLFDSETNDSEQVSLPETTKPLGQKILEDFNKAFQNFLDALAWRELRLCIHFFAHLTLDRVLSPGSMLALLQSFVSVLDEPGVSYGRSLQAALCVGEGLMRAGSTLKEYSPSGVDAVITSLTIFSDSTTGAKTLVQPLVILCGNEGTAAQGATERLESLLLSLKTLASSGFELPNVLSHDLSQLSLTPLCDLPAVLVPPELELELASGEKALEKREEMPHYSIRLFEDEITPNPATPGGYILHTLLGDIVDIFEVNRKECARILLEMPRWCGSGTFKPKPGASPSDEETTEITGWQLETAIIESILSALFMLPQPTYQPVYYFAVITDLCKVSPTTVGPAVGKSIRKIYSLLGEGLDVEISRRFADWFAIHMSNFSFLWVWKEWVPDLNLDAFHPKRVFIRRVLELEIRLSYYDRILRTLPEAFQGEEAQAMPSEAPSTEFEYDLPSHPHHEAAQSLLNLLRGRSKAEEVIAHVETLKTNLAETTESEIRAASVVRSICIQSLLLLGSRSFSHFLNAIERYLPLLRSLGGSSESKAEILEAVGDFWRRNRQMINIVFDKLMQYQIVDPVDVVAWAFMNKGAGGKVDGLGAHEWDLLKGALDKSSGRVVVANRKIKLIRKDEDDATARAKAIVNNGMDVDNETKDEEAPQPTAESAVVLAALKAHSTLSQDQRRAFSRALEGFVTVLSGTDDLLSQDTWNKRAKWGKSRWDVWETWGWYRHFCRLYAPHLRNHTIELQTISFSALKEGSSSTLLKRIWAVAVDGDL